MRKPAFATKDLLPPGGDVTLIYCVGYETRSGFVTNADPWRSARSAAIVYGQRQVASFTDNLERARARGHELWDDDRTKIGDRVAEFVVGGRAKGCRHFAVDVSAMDRGLMAAVLLSAIETVAPNESLHILYAPSRFQDRDTQLLPIRQFGAAHVALTGKLSEPKPSTCLVIGLGFEYGVSLNIMDMHDPDSTFAFVAEAIDPQFDEAVKRANFDFDFGNNNVSIIHYPLRSPVFLMDNIISSLRPLQNSKIIIAPMGPKIFSACCIVSSYLYFEDATLLRYSVGHEDDAYDVFASGEIIGLTMLRLDKSNQADSDTAQ